MLTIVDTSSLRVLCLLQHRVPVTSRRGVVVCCCSWCHREASQMHGTPAGPLAEAISRRDATLGKQLNFLQKHDCIRVRTAHVSSNATADCVTEWRSETRFRNSSEQAPGSDSAMSGRASKALMRALDCGTTSSEQRSKRTKQRMTLHPALRVGKSPAAQCSF